MHEAGELSEKERLRLDEELRQLSAESTKLWNGRADKKAWDEVRADLSVYRLSGSVVTDPRRTPEYRAQVVQGLGFGDNWKETRPYFSESDVQAVREVVSRKAAVSG